MRNSGRRIANLEGKGALLNCAICDGYALMLAQVFCLGFDDEGLHVAIEISCVLEQASTVAGVDSMPMCSSAFSP